MRGDGYDVIGIEEATTGSPPRAWGRPLPRWPSARWARFTPTCVGTAGTRAPAGFVMPVHPHVRGDGPLLFIISVAQYGSPPRGWGRRRRVGVLRRDVRFTP